MIGDLQLCIRIKCLKLVHVKQILRSYRGKVGDASLCFSQVRNSTAEAVHCAELPAVHNIVANLVLTTRPLRLSISVKLLLTGRINCCPH
jgi:hypothetical protein